MGETVNFAGCTIYQLTLDSSVGPAFHPICSFIFWMNGGSTGLAQDTLDRPPPAPPRRDIFLTRSWVSMALVTWRHGRFGQRSWRDFKDVVTWAYFLSRGDHCQRSGHWNEFSQRVPGKSWDDFVGKDCLQSPQSLKTAKRIDSHEGEMIALPMRAHSKKNKDTFWFNFFFISWVKMRM